MLARTRTGSPLSLAFVGVRCAVLVFLLHKIKMVKSVIICRGLSLFKKKLVKIIKSFSVCQA